MSPTVSIDLSRFDESYATAPSGEELFPAEVPDGEYRTVIEDVRLTESSNGNPMLVWTLRITDPPHEDRTLRKNRAITERTIPWVKDDLTKCGLELQKLSQLPGFLDKMLGREMSVLKRTREGRANLFFLRQVRVRQAREEDEDVPF